MQELRAQHRNQNLLLIAHGLTNRALLGSLRGLSTAEAYALPSLANTEVIIVNQAGDVTVRDMSNPRALPNAQTTIDFGALERSIADEMKAQNVPGVQVAVISGDRVVWQKGFGVANAETREPVTTDTLFRLGSTTKMFVAAAAIALVEQGKLDLHKPVGEYAKGLHPQIARLTLRQLLSHTAGLKDEAPMTGPLGVHGIGIGRAAFGAGTIAAASARVPRNWDSAVPETHTCFILSTSKMRACPVLLMVDVVARELDDERLTQTGFSCEDLSMQTLRQDLLYGLRMLWKRPGFTLVAVISMGLGIGANAAIFSVVNALLLRPLPYPNPERLVVLEEADLRNPERTSSVTAPDFADWRARNTTLEGVAAFQYTNFILTGGTEPESLIAVLASHGLTETLGVQPLLGRTFTADEDKPKQRARVALLSYGLWQRRFALDRNIVGQTLNLNSEAYTIIGVMPQEFKYPNRRVDVWVPAGLDPTRIQNSKTSFLQVVARLKANVTVEQARADLGTLAAQLAKDHPDTNEFSTVAVTGLVTKMLGDLRLALLVLSGAVAFVLLIACANAANLLLARAVARQKEMSIRLALGAGRGRIVRQLLTESLLLSLLGGALGILLAAFGVDTLQKFMPSGMRFMEITVNRTVLFYTLGLSVLTGFIFGLYPAWQAAQTSLNEVLKEGGGKGSVMIGSRRFRHALVVGEIALTLLLLIGAGLLLQSFRKLQNVQPGFETNNILTMNVSLPRAKYQEPLQQAAFYTRALTNLRAVPGVQAAGLVTNLPLGNSLSASSFRIDGRPEPARGDSPQASDCKISPEYFRTMGIRLLRGRDFDARDVKESQGVVIINQALAERYFPNEDPLGKHLTIGTPEEERLYGKGVSREIIGIVGNSRFSLDKAPDPELYVTYQQLPEATFTVVLKTLGEPGAISQAARNAIYQADPQQAVRNVRPMQEWLSEAMAPRQFSALLIGIFAGIALLLASAGIFGVMSYTVTQRTNEIGIRMALGAQTTQVLRLVLGQGLKLATLGVTIGLVGAWAVTRFLKSILYEVNATDPWLFGGLTALLLLIAMAACYWPARRATKVDPLVALRSE